jgi:Flp pilus assembly protein TadB
MRLHRDDFVTGNVVSAIINRDYRACRARERIRAQVAAMIAETTMTV